MSESDSSQHKDRDAKFGRGGVSRRDVLKGTAGAALAGLSASAAAQYSGLMEGGLGVPFRLPLGALNYLDRNQYIHNMAILSYPEGRQLASG